MCIRDRTVRYKGKTIADVLQMYFAEAAEFFESQPRISDPLKLLAEAVYKRQLPWRFRKAVLRP